LRNKLELIRNKPKERELLKRRQRKRKQKEKKLNKRDSRRKKQKKK
jgi:hypothetical protein